MNGRRAWWLLAAAAGAAGGALVALIAPHGAEDQDAATETEHPREGESAPTITGGPTLAGFEASSSAAASPASGRERPRGLTAWDEWQRIADLSTVEDLVASLRTGVSLNQRFAAEQLAMRGEQAVARLREALKDPQPLMRAWVMYALSLCEASPSVVPDLVAILEDLERPESDREKAAIALGGVGQGSAAAASALNGRLDDPLESVHRAAVVALGRVGPVAVPGLRTALQNLSTHVQHGAAQALGLIGAGAAEAVPDLAKILDHEDGDENVRIQVAAALGGIGRAAASVAPVLARAVTGDSLLVGQTALSAFRVLGAAAAPVAPDLLLALGSRDADVRDRASRALGFIGVDAPTVCRKLLDLWVADEEIREGVAQGLGSFGEAAAPVLAAALEGSDAVRAQAALAALNYSDPLPQGVALALVAKSRDRDPHVRLQAVTRLARYSPASEVIVAGLSRAIKDPDEEVSQRAAQAIGDLGRPGLPAILAACRSHDPSVRWGAVYALSSWRLNDVDLSTARPILRSLREDEDRAVREFAESLWIHLFGD